MSKTKTRIYVVTSKVAAEGAAPKSRLVRAANQAQARNHVARETLISEVASQDDLVRLVGAGTAIEVASAEVLPVGSTA